MVIIMQVSLCAQRDTKAAQVQTEKVGKIQQCVRLPLKL